MRMSLDVSRAAIGDFWRLCFRRHRIAIKNALSVDPYVLHEACTLAIKGIRFGRGKFTPRLPSIGFSCSAVGRWFCQAWARLSFCLPFWISAGFLEAQGERRRKKRLLRIRLDLT